MNPIPKLASSLGRNDEIPNIELAKEISLTGDSSAIKELISNLTTGNKNIQHDVIKVLYEIGNLNPELVSDYANNFIDLLKSNDNRMVWGAMTALGSVVNDSYEIIAKRIDEVIKANSVGSVITQDWGVRVMAVISSKSYDLEKKLFPILIKFITECPPKDFAKHAESILVTVHQTNKSEFIAVLNKRKQSLKNTAQKRVEKLIKLLENMPFKA